MYVKQNVRPASVVRSLLAVVREEQLSFLAAAVAYYAFVSLFPLTLLAIAIASAVAGEQFATQVVSLLQEFLTPEAARLLEGALASERGRSGATVIGLATLVWSSLRLFRGLDVAFARVYGVESPVAFLTQVRNALLVLAGMSVAIGTTALLTSVLPLARAPLPRLGAPLFLLVVLTVSFLPLYYVFARRTVTLRGVLPGAMLAAGGWTLLSTGFGIYADRAASFQVYGVVGAVLLVLAWFYVGGLVVLFGAALNATLAGYRDRQLQQGPRRDVTRGMSESEEPPDGGETDSEEEPDAGVSTVESEAVDYEDFATLRNELEALEERVDDRTVHREELESDLEQYVRNRVRRGHAQGWGPYLVLLYGTAMTLGAFSFLSGGWAILAMLVIWLSTLGLYALMLLVGVTVTAAGAPGRILDRLRNLR